MDIVYIDFGFSLLAALLCGFFAQRKAWIGAAVTGWWSVVFLLFAFLHLIGMRMGQ